MPYTLHRLSAGSYDLLLRGKIIGSVVRNFPSLGTSEDGVLSSSRIYLLRSGRSLSLKAGMPLGRLMPPGSALTPLLWQRISDPREPNIDGR